MGKGYLPENIDVTGDSIRWYFVPELNEYVPSVTSILDKGFPKSPGLLIWFKKCTEEEINAKSEEGKRKGTEAHEIIERCIREGADGKPNRKILTPREKLIVKGWLNWLDANDVTFLEQERAIFYCEDGIRTAGRFDALAMVNGKKMALDWKRSKSIYESYPPQLALYAKAVGAEYGAILRLSDTKIGYQFKEINVASDYEAFKNAYNLACYLGIFKCQPQKEEEK